MKALIAMSGGVDSSLAAKLTIELGYDCIGCTMHLFDNESAGIERSRTCCSLDDVEDARSVAYKLGMPFYVFNFTEEFKEQVIRKFADSYERGMTPNPCIDCNKKMKFEKLYDRAMTLGCDKVVTGHYARIVYENGEYKLKKALDQSKDQSYVLYFLSQEQLAHTLFPLGELHKTEVREIARESGFVNSDKPDSQDICFVPDHDYARVIKIHTGKDAPAGNFTDTGGNILGVHKGIINYTVGQRKGLGIAFGEPMYVCRIDPEQNTVILGRNEELYSKEVRVTDVSFVSEKAPDAPVRCTAKLRYRQKDEPATLIPQDNGDVLLTFDSPQRAVTPGQAAVFYDGDTVLGGGTIASAKLRPVIPS